MFKPQHTLLFLLAVGCICGLIMYVFPAQGIPLIQNYSLKFATWEDFEEKDTIVPVIDVEELLASYEEPFDSVAFKDSLKLHAFNVRQEKLRIHYADGGVHLQRFFDALENDAKTSKVRILHYGDSQIEGDRISSYLRDKLQKEFGGRGPGYAPPINQVPSMSLKQDNSENWIRYTIFGRKDTTVKHKEYGLYGIFGRFTPYSNDTLPKDSVKAWITFDRSNIGYSGTRVYRTATMLYGNVKEPFKLSVYSNDELIYSEVLSGSTNNEKVKWSFRSTPKALRFEFEGTESPDIYAFRFEDSRGVVVDNIAMRGSSGTIFAKIKSSQLRKQYRDSDASLIILQYGGNTVPYIDSKEEAKRYGNWLGRQIALVKRLNPQASLVLIGPSDMATKDKTDYVTFPFLIEVRDVLKQAAFENDCGFWDIFEVMGGENSMQSWVDADPPLAAKDYVHFTPKGAKHVASLFYDAMMKDYRVYKDYNEQLRLRQLQLDSIQQLNDTLLNDSTPQT